MKVKRSHRLEVYAGKNAKPFVAESSSYEAKPKTRHKVSQTCENKVEVGNKVDN